MREAVRLPPGEDLNEWLAVNTVDFYNAISVLYSTLDECCTATTCPIMSAGPKVCCVLFLLGDSGSRTLLPYSHGRGLLSLVLTAV